MAAAAPSRGMATLKRAAWDGWPRRAKAGWPFARWLKHTHRDAYESKQARRLRLGTNKGAARSRRVRHARPKAALTRSLPTSSPPPGRDAQQLQARLRAVPMFTSRLHTLVQARFGPQQHVLPAL